MTSYIPDVKFRPKTTNQTGDHRIRIAQYRNPNITSYIPDMNRRSNFPTVISNGFNYSQKGLSKDNLVT